MSKPIHPKPQTLLHATEEILGGCLKVLRPLSAAPWLLLFCWVPEWYPFALFGLGTPYSNQIVGKGYAYYKGATQEPSLTKAPSANIVGVWLDTWRYTIILGPFGCHDLGFGGLGPQLWFGNMGVSESFFGGPYYKDRIL